MSRKNSVGEIKVWFVPTLASTSAPSAASITSGTDLTGYLLRDGLSTPNSGNTIDVSDASSRFNKTAPGTRGGDALSMTLLRDSVTGSDLAWSTLAEDTAGYIVVRRFGGSTVAAAATQKAEVYTGTVISREMSPIGDQSQRFTVSFSIEAAPELSATMAA